MRTQVGILGAGPAGLLLAHLLHLRGIRSVVLEARSQGYVKGRVRAGVLETGSVETLVAAGVGDRLRCEALVHDGIVLAFDGHHHVIDARALTGKVVTVYGQQEVVRDLIAARHAAGGALLFEARATGLHDLHTDTPVIEFEHGGQTGRLECDIVAGCDGFHGLSRAAIPADALTIYERVYPFSWLGILAHAPPSSDMVVYANHPSGFALSSMRSAEVSRLYLQSAPGDDLEAWPDERIWDALEERLSDGGRSTVRRGPVLQKGITPMRSVVAAPMRHERLFLAGDAAHIVPPTGAKGMNLAIADIRVLAHALGAFFTEHRTDLLEAYSDTCLARVWKVQRFSWFVTSMMHRFPDADPFDRELQMAQLRYLAGSRAAQESFAENYVGLPLDLA